MKVSFARWLLLAWLGAGTLLVTSPGPRATATPRPKNVPKTVPKTVDDATRQRVLTAFANAPLSFEPNCGQAPTEAHYVAHGSNYQLRLGARGVRLAMQLGGGQTAELGLQFPGAQPAPQLEALDKQRGTTTHLLDDGRRLDRLPNFARVRYRALYPGVDLLFYGHEQRLEYDFVLAPGADPRVIRLAFSGAERVQIDKQGDLLVYADGREWRQRAPVVYQEREGRRVPVAGRYVRRGAGFGFALGQYDRRAPLVIDPVLDYARHWWTPAGVAVDSAGNVYLAGGNSGFWITYMSGLNDERLSSIGIGSRGSAATAVAADDTGVYVAGTVTGSVVGYGSLNEQPGINSRLRLMMELGNGGTSWNARLNADNTLGLSFLPPAGLRLRALLIHPNDPDTLYAGDGGAVANDLGATWPLYKRGYFPPDNLGNPGGFAWRSISDGLAGLTRLKPLAILPGAQPTLLVSTSGGLRKTQNDGATWTRAGLDVPNLNTLVFSRQNPQLLYAATNSTVYKSTDGGATWAQAARGLPADATQLDLVIDPNTATTLYAVARAAAGNGIFKTTDGAANWQPLALGFNDRGVLTLAVNPLETSMLYAGTTRGLLRSLNGGVSWQPAGLEELQVTRLALDPLTPATIYASTPFTAAGRFAGGVAKSTNGGQSWSPLNLLQGYQVETLVVDPAQPARLLVGLACKAAAFVFKLYVPADVSQSNETRFVTYVNGVDSQAAQSLAVDGAGNVYLTGKLLNEFLTPEQAGGQGFFIKLSATGAIASPRLTLAGTGQSVAVDEAGLAYVAGTVASTMPLTVKNGFQSTPSGSHDAFLMKFDPAQTGDAALHYATYLGGGGRDESVALALNAAKQVYLTGSTASLNFPTLGPSLTSSGNIFVAKLDPARSGSGSLLWSSYFGTGKVSGVAVDGVNQPEALYLIGATQANDFPTTPNALQRQLTGGTCSGAPCADAFVAKLSGATPSLLYATLLGAANSQDEGIGPALDPDGKVFFASLGKPPAGTTLKPEWLFRSDGYLGRLDLRAFNTGVVIPLAVTNVSAASYSGAILSAEAITAAFGSNLATGTQVANSTPLPTTLGGTTIKVRDRAGVERLAPLFFVSPTQINYLLPAGTSIGAATVTVTNANNVVSQGTLSIAQVAPGVFTAEASGRGLAAAVALRLKADGTQRYEAIAQFDRNQNRFVGLPLDLGPAGEQVFLLLYGTGWRNRSNFIQPGATFSGLTTATAVAFAGAQGDLAGLDQANVLLPRSLAGRGEVEVTLYVDGQAANPVKVWVK